MELVIYTINNLYTSKLHGKIQRGI